MAKLFIYTLWESSAHMDDNPDIPWLVDAVDEHTIADGDSREYEKKRDHKDRRELVIEIDEAAVRKLFDAPVVKGTVIGG